MAERKNINNFPPMETSLSLLASRGKNRGVTNQFSITGFNKRQEQQIFSGDALVNMIKHPPLPGGTGQIINIGV